MERLLRGQPVPGDHVVKGGFDFQKDEFYNLFLQNYTGSYEFSSIADFQNGIYRRYRLNVPAAGYTLDNVAAVFNQKQYGLFLQDTWKASDRLSLQYGLRYDMPHVDPLPTFNPCFAAAPGAASLGSKGVCGLRANPANPGAAVAVWILQPGHDRRQCRLAATILLQLCVRYSAADPVARGAGLFVSNTPAVWSQPVLQQRRGRHRL